MRRTLPAWRRATARAAAVVLLAVILGAVAANLGPPGYAFVAAATVAATVGLVGGVFVQPALYRAVRDRPDGQAGPDAD